jgi:hypothetical protein
VVTKGPWEGAGLDWWGSASGVGKEMFEIVGRSGIIFWVGGYKHFGPLDLRRSWCDLESRWSVSGACRGGGRGLLTEGKRGNCQAYSGDGRRGTEGREGMKKQVMPDDLLRCLEGV